MRKLMRLLALVAFTFAAMVALATTASAADGVTPPVLADTASWALLAGFLTPLLTSLVQQPGWSNRVRTIVAVVASVVVGVVTLLANGAFNDGAQTVLSIVALVVVTSATAYKTIWVPVGVAPAIENATSKTPPKAPDPSGQPPTGTL